MSLIVKTQFDFSSTLIRALNSLKEAKIIKFDYYTIIPNHLGGQELMVADEIISFVKIMKKAFSRDVDILLLSEKSDSLCDYYFYMKNNKFSESFFEKIVDMKPVYGHMLKLEQNWKKLGFSINTFNVSDSDDCCLMLSFDNRARTM